MAEKNEASRATTGRHLVINPFGRATLIGRNVTVSNDTPTNNPVGTEGFDYLIRANPSQNIDIQFRDDVGATISIEMNERTITRLRLSATELYIGNSHYANNVGLFQRFVQDAPNYGEMRSTFRLVLADSQMFRRLDIRYSNFSWITILIYRRRIMAVVLNGPNLIEMLQMSSEEALQRGVRSQELNVEPSTQFGLRPHANISRPPSRLNTPNRSRNEAIDMPRLIPSSRLTAEQLAYVAERRNLARNQLNARRELEAQPNENEAEEENEGAVGGANLYSPSVADLIAEQIYRPFRWANTDDEDN